MRERERERDLRQSEMEGGREGERESRARALEKRSDSDVRQHTDRQLGKQNTEREKDRKVCGWWVYYALVRTRGTFEKGKPYGHDPMYHRTCPRAFCGHSCYTLAEACIERYLLMSLINPSLKNSIRTVTKKDLNGFSRS